MVIPQLLIKVCRASYQVMLWSCKNIHTCKYIELIYMANLGGNDSTWCIPALGSRMTSFSYQKLNKALPFLIKMGKRLKNTYQWVYQCKTHEELLILFIYISEFEFKLTHRPSTSCFVIVKYPPNIQAIQTSGWNIPWIHRRHKHTETINIKN